jgi:ferrochelatase
VSERFDAVLVVSFGGPEKPEEVMPFLENVTRGRNIPRARLEEVAKHYHHFGGKSPINDQCRALVTALRDALRERGPDVPVYWGNRNWRPFLADTVRDMERGGVKRALAFVTSAFGSYSGCRQYLEDIERARADVGTTMRIEKLREFHDHPGFLQPMIERVRVARAWLERSESGAELRDAPRGVRGAPPGEDSGGGGWADVLNPSDAPVIYTAHSVPSSMAASSPYVAQLEETCRAVSEGAGVARWELAWQSRSGPPHVPWLEPDIVARLRALREAGETDVVVAPIGFLSDHMEVLYDIDVEARAVAAEIGLRLARAGTVGTHPRFIEMIRELVTERVEGAPAAECAPGCCAPPGR